MRAERVVTVPLQPYFGFHSVWVKKLPFPVAPEKGALSPKIPIFLLVPCREIGPSPQYGWDFPEEIPERFRKDPGNALRAFPGVPLESTAGMPQTL